MNAPRTSPAARIEHAWARWYTAGLAADVAELRRAEIASDVADHTDARRRDGWPAARIDAEQLSRLVRGIPSDLAWRREMLAGNAWSNPALRSVVLVTTTVASIFVGAFFVAFAVYLGGHHALADHTLLGGFDNYVEETGRSATVAAVVIGSLGIVVAGASLVRYIAPLTANIATIAAATWGILFFWLGIAPLAAVAVAGSCVDMVLRAPAIHRSRN